MHSSGEEYSHDEDGADVPLLTVSDINPDMLEVTITQRSSPDVSFSRGTLPLVPFLAQGNTMILLIAIEPTGTRECGVGDPAKNSLKSTGVTETGFAKYTV